MNKLAIMLFIVLGIQVHGYIEVERIPNSLFEWGEMLGLIASTLLLTICSVDKLNEQYQSK